MPRPTLASAARPAAVAVLFVLGLVGGASAAHAQSSTTSSVVPTLGTAAAPAAAGDAVTVSTLEPSAINRPLTSSEQRLESLDRWAIGGFVLLSLIVVLLRQRRRRTHLDPEDQPDHERDEWDAALAELTAQHRDGADDAAGDR